MYHHRREFDLALDHHTRALALREANPASESADIVASLIGKANAHWACHQHAKAITDGERALALQEAVVPRSERSVATSLAWLAKIYQDSGNYAHALELCTKALNLFEPILPAYHRILAEIFYTMGKIQLRLKALTDAQLCFERSAEMYGRLVPPGHQARSSAEHEFRRVTKLLQESEQNSQTNS